MRVLLADDQALFRRGIHTVLNGESDIEIVAEAEDGQTAIDQVADLAPDVVLMDVRMPGMTGIEATRGIKSASPSTAILMLTMSDEEDDLYDAIRAGASGYLLKESSISTVAEAIRSVMAGESFLSPAMASKLLLEFNALNTHKDEEPERQLSAAIQSLTTREVEILRHVALGQSNKEIADEIGIAENTVKNQVRNCIEKLHTNNRMEAAMYAVEARLLEEDPS